MMLGARALALVVAAVAARAGDADVDVDAYGEQYDEAYDELELDIGQMNLGEKVQTMEFDLDVGFEDSLGTALGEQGMHRNVDTGSGLAVPVADVEDLKAFVAGDGGDDDLGGGVLGLFRAEPGPGDLAGRVAAPQAWASFVALSDAMAAKGVRFAAATEGALIDAYAVRAWRVVAFKPPQLAGPDTGEELETDLPTSEGPDAPIDAEAFADFAATALLPQVGLITYENEGLFEQLGRPVVCVYAAVDLGKKASYLGLLAGKLRGVARRVRESLEGAEPEPAYALVDLRADATRLRFFSAELIFGLSKREATGAVLVAVRARRGVYYTVDGLLSEPTTLSRAIVAALRGKRKPVHLEGQMLQAAQGPSAGSEAEAEARQAEAHCAADPAAEACAASLDDDLDGTQSPLE